MFDAQLGCVPSEIRRQLSPIHIKYRSFDGVKYGIMVVNNAIIDNTLSFFKDLFAEGFIINDIQPAHGRLDKELIDLNITSAFNYRTVAGKDVLSKHAYGFAIDINPKMNPASPTIYEEYYIHGYDGPGLITRLEVDIAATHGFSWGGDMFKAFYDPHHFQIKE